MCRSFQKSIEYKRPPKHLLFILPLPSYAYIMVTMPGVPKLTQHTRGVPTQSNILPSRCFPPKVEENISHSCTTQLWFLGCAGHNLARGKDEVAENRHALFPPRRPARLWATERCAAPRVHPLLLRLMPLCSVVLECRIICIRPRFHGGKSKAASLPTVGPGLMHLGLVVVAMPANKYLPTRRD